MALLARPRLLRFLGGTLIGLVGGLACLVAITLLPSVFGFYPLVVVSGSMEPTIHVGDIAVVRKQDPYSFQIGNVVTYSTAGGNITHRIVGMDITPQGPFFLMRGDANLTADPRAIPAQAIVGKVVYRVPRMGFLVSFVNSMAGRILFVAAPLLMLALLWVRRTTRRRSPAFPPEGPSSIGSADPGSGDPQRKANTTCRAEKLVPRCEKARYIPPLEWFDKLTTSGGKVPLILSNVEGHERDLMCDVITRTYERKY